MRLIETWFARHQRPLPWRDAYDPYHVWLSEVMAQQTRLEVALPYFERFVARFPTLAALALATEDDVLALWSGLGYYRRAKMLRAGAVFVMETHGGRLPDTVEALREIPGVGRYTAGAIASIAFEQKAPVVDGNVTRVTARLWGSDGDTWQRAEDLVTAATSARAFNQGLMEFGARICKPAAPACPECPLRTVCVAFASGTVSSLPARKAKKAPEEMQVTLFLVRDRRGRVLMRRERGPLMDAMFHLPHGGASPFTGPALTAEPDVHLGSFRHTITSRRIEFSVCSAKVGRLRESTGEYEWIDPELLHTIPHPSWVKKALRSAGVIS